MREHGDGGLALRDVVSAGEALRITPAIRALFQALPDAALHNHYGPTETHVVTASTLAGDPAAWPELPDIGAPLPHVRIAFADDGGLLLGGDCLAAGYVGRPELTAERFVERDGARWYVTGDRVAARPDGVLEYLGRLDQQLKIGGFRVEPGEVELALLALPQVRAAAVGARTLDDGVPALVAWVVLREARDVGEERPASLRDDGGHADEENVASSRSARGGVAEQILASLRDDGGHADEENVASPRSARRGVAEEILASLRARLPAYLVPARIVELDALPTTASGKVDLAALPSPTPATAFADDASAASVVEAIWREELGLDELAPDTNVFDAGATSLAVGRFVAALARRSRYSLSIADVYAAPTVRALASRTAARTTNSDAASRRGARQRDALARWRNGAGARA